MSHDMAPCAQGRRWARPPLATHLLPALPQPVAWQPCSGTRNLVVLGPALV